MRPFLEVVFFLCAFIVVVTAQTPESYLGESRLAVHTLVREDLFAAWLDDDLERLARGERNIETMLRDKPIRPNQTAHLLAWKAGADYYRAVRAHEAGAPDAFQQHYDRARQGMSQALAANDVTGVAAHAIVGAALVLFADRVPTQHRAEAWAAAYTAYVSMWKLQGATVDKLPVHPRGELLGGLVQTAYRMGRVDEANQFADRMLSSLAGTPYEAAAQEWKMNPASATASRLTCKSCHEPGRLRARLASISK